MPNLAQNAYGFAVRPEGLTKLAAYNELEVIKALEDPCQSCQWIWEQFAHNMDPPTLTSAAPHGSVGWDAGKASRGEYHAWKQGFDVRRIENLSLRPGATRIN